MDKRYVGAFVSCAGGLQNAVVNGEALGVNTIMMHPSPPQRWCLKPFDPANIAAFNEAKAKSSIEKVFMHGIYLTNLAHPDKQKWHLGKQSLVHYMDLATAIKSDGVMFHTGSLKDTTEEAGFAQVAFSVDWIFEKSPGDSILMLEVAAGAGSVIGDKMDELARIYEMVKNKDRLFFCLDTQHLFASGYDLVGDLEGVVKEVERTFGIENIRCIHFNDSKTELGSMKDRHENIGTGMIGENAMKAILNHPKLKHIPFVMETPALKGDDLARAEAQKLISWAK